jgi:GDP-4-dehydro-6-deoxy-D-mannose reductase
MPGPLLVTGAGGFIGSAVVAEAVTSGAEVVALVRAEEPRVEGDCVTCIEVDWGSNDILRVVDKTAPAGIVHAAGHSGRFVGDPDPRALYQANVATVWQLLDAVRVSGLAARVVLLSSASVYGAEPPVPTTEDTPLVPATHYAASKVAAEQIAFAFARTGEASALVARPFNVLGPGEPPGSVVSRIAPQLRTVPPKAEARVAVREAVSTRDFVDVADLAAALVLLARAGTPGEAYNVCSGVPVTIAELVERTAAAFDRGLRLEVEQPDAHPSVSLGDSSKLKALGWAPAFTLDQTLVRMAAAGEEAVR